MHFYQKEIIVMTATNYQIYGLSNPSALMTVSGTAYFQKNLSAKNYPLRSAVIVNNVLRMAFEPCNLPDALMHGEHFIEMKPQKDIIVALKTILDRGGRKRVLYRIIDSVEIGHQLYFRARKYAYHTDGKYEDFGIGYGAGKDGIPEEGFELIGARCSYCHGVIRVYVG